MDDETITLLGLESSCDDTAAAVVRLSGGKSAILSSVVAGQNDLHAAFGGVVPEIAARAHVEKVDLCVEEALAKAGIALCDVNGIAVTAGPGEDERQTTALWWNPAGAAAPASGPVSAESVTSKAS